MATQIQSFLWGGWLLFQFLYFSSTHFCGFGLQSVTETLWFSSAKGCVSYLLAYWGCKHCYHHIWGITYCGSTACPWLQLYNRKKKSILSMLGSRNVQTKQNLVMQHMLFHIIWVNLACLCYSNQNLVMQVETVKIAEQVWLHLYRVKVRTDQVLFHNRERWGQKNKLIVPCVPTYKLRGIKSGFLYCKQKSGFLPWVF
jgi:hypothetical protein